MPRRLVRVDPAPIRTKPVLVRLTPSEHAAVTRLAEQQGCTLPDVLRAGLHLLQLTETP